MKETMARIVIFRLASTLLTLGFLFTLYRLFNVYDWGFPHVKLLCFSILFVAIETLQILAFRASVPRAALWIEAVLLVVVLQVIFVFQLNTHAGKLLEPPVSDIGYTTIHAAKVLFNEGQNPYSQKDINHARRDLGEGYRGFHYGPFMTVGYFPSAFLPPAAYKPMSYLWVLCTVVLLMLLLLRPGETELQYVNKAVFVLTAYFMADRFWIELVHEGANDVFHIMLILIALLALKKERVFLAGLFTGLSIASKFAPGAFLVPFMPVRKLEFWLGLALGLTPYLPFLFWDPAGLWRNVFWLRVVIPHDITSLYWLLPPRMTWILGVVMLISCVAATIWAIGSELSFEATLVGFTLLLIIVDVTQKQIHGNHLIWFFPLLALLFVDYRERLFGSLASRLRPA